MPNIDRIESLADIPQIDAEFKVIIGNLKDVKQNIADLGKLQSFVKSTTSIKELRTASEQLNKTTNDSIIIEKKLISVQDAKAAALKKVQTAEENKNLKIQAELENSVAGSVEHAAAMVKNLEYQLSILNVTTDKGKIKQQELLEQLAKYKDFVNANKSSTLLQTQTPGAPPVQKLSDRPIESIPFEIGGNKDKINEAETAVTDLEKAEVDAIASANEWARAQKAAADEVAGPELKDAAKNVTVYADELESLTGTLEENQQLQRIYKSELADIKSELKLLETTTSTAEKSTDKYKNKVANLVDQETKLKNESKDLDKTIRNQTIDQNSAAGSVDKLRARYALLLRELERGGDAFKKTQIGKNILKEAQETKVALDTAERDAFNFKGSLTNTGSAITGFFSKAFTGLRTLAAFIPGIGLAGLISVIADTVIDFTASLFDNEKSVKAVAAAQKDFAEQLTETNDALQEQITLLTDGYGSGIELLKSQLALLEKSGASASAIAAKKVELLKQENKLSDDALNLQIKRAEQDNDNFANGRTGYEALEYSIEAYRKEVEYSSNRVIELENKKNDILRLGGKGSTDDLDKQIEAEKAALGARKKIYNDYYGAAKDSFDKQNALDEEQADQSNKITEQRKKAILDLIKFEQGLKIKDNKEIVDDSITSRSGKIVAARAVADAEKEIAQAQYDFDLSNLKKEALNKENFNKQKLLLDEKYADDVQTIEENLSSSINKININKLIADRKYQEDLLQQEKDYLAKREAEEKAALDRRVGFVNDNLQQRLSIMQTSADIELSKYIDLYNKGKITRHKLEKEDQRITKDLLLKGLDAQIQHDISLYNATIEDNDKRADAEKKYGDLLLKIQGKSTYDRLELELNYYEEVLKASNLTGKALTDAEAALAAARKKIKQQQQKDAEFKSPFFKARQDQDEFLEGLDKIKSAYGDIANVIGGILDVGYTKKKNAIQQQIDDIDRVTQAEIDAVNASVLTAQEKADKITAIEATAAAKKAALELKQRELDRKKAQFEKAQAIASIILGTAVAVANAKNLFEAIARAALGAAQLAIAIATPVPQYKHGTGDSGHPGGPAIVGDGGKPEAIILPDGTVLKSPGTATMIDMPKGTIVEPDYQKYVDSVLRASMTDAPEYKGQSIIVEGPDNTKAIEKMERNVVMAIKNKKELDVDINHVGIVALWKSGASKTKYINDQTNW